MDIGQTLKLREESEQLNESLRAGGRYALSQSARVAALKRLRDTREELDGIKEVSA